jgi:uncharacterized protein CbrC (UPF0167 family)
LAARLKYPEQYKPRVTGAGALELQALACERARKNKRIYNISEAKYCRDVCQFNKDGVCTWER